VAGPEAPERARDAHRRGQHALLDARDGAVVGARHEAPRDEVVTARERRAHAARPVRQRQAVGVGAREVRGTARDRGAHARVGRRARALLRLVDDAPPRHAPRRRGLADEVPRAVRRPVVDHDEVEVGVLLRAQGLQRRDDPVRLVPRGHHDREALRPRDVPREPARAHSRTTVAPMLMPPARPTSTTTSPGPTRPVSSAVASWSGSVADATLPWSATVTSVRPVGRPRAACTSSRYATATWW